VCGRHSGRDEELRDADVVTVDGTHGLVLEVGRLPPNRLSNLLETEHQCEAAEVARLRRRFSSTCRNRRRSAVRPHWMWTESALCAKPAANVASASAMRSTYSSPRVPPRVAAGMSTLERLDHHELRALTGGSKLAPEVIVEREQPLAHVDGIRSRVDESMVRREHRPLRGDPPPRRLQ